MPGTLVAKCASTMTRPRLSFFTPTSSSPSPSVNGTRPIATSTTSVSMASAAPPLAGSIAAFSTAPAPSTPVTATALAAALEGAAMLLHQPLQLAADLAVEAGQDALNGILPGIDGEVG